MKTGLCSITFRQCSPEALVGLVAKAGLDAIEWGGDVHVPHGDTLTAKRVLRLTHDAGLEVSSYGSYYSPLDSTGNVEDFAPVLDAALALETDTIRIWPGRKPADQFSKAEYLKFVDESDSAADLAQSQGVKLAFEFHTRCLTDTHEGALQLLEEIGHPNIYSYWQPPYWCADIDYRLNGLKALKNNLLNLHVFHWLFDDEGGARSFDNSYSRCPLVDGAAEWKLYFNEVHASAKFALLEFVLNDDPDVFMRDAATLTRWVAERHA